MGQQDEHEMLIEYSEMTSFDFDSEEFRKVRKDYIDCKNKITDLYWSMKTFFEKFRPAKNY